MTTTLASLTEKAFANLKLGDWFSEMCIFNLYIMEIKPTGEIYTIEDSSTKCVGRSYKTIKDLQYRLSYKTSPGYWCSYYGNYDIQKLKERFKETRFIPIEEVEQLELEEKLKKIDKSILNKKKEIKCLIKEREKLENISH